MVVLVKRRLYRGNTPSSAPPLRLHAVRRCLQTRARAPLRLSPPLLRPYHPSVHSAARQSPPVTNEVPWFIRLSCVHGCIQEIVQQAAGILIMFNHRLTSTLQLQFMVTITENKETDKEDRRKEDGQAENELLCPRHSLVSCAGHQREKTDTSNTDAESKCLELQNLRTLYSMLPWRPAGLSWFRCQNSSGPLQAVMQTFCSAPCRFSSLSPTLATSLAVSPTIITHCTTAVC